MPKVAIKWVSNDVESNLNDFHFRVRVSSGVESILDSSNRVLSKRHKDGSLTMLMVYFMNVDNLVD